MQTSSSLQNIYAYNILKSTKANFNQSHSFLFSTILHLESELEYGVMETSQFAKSLLETINQSGAFRTLDRVCLSITHPGSSKITVYSSFNSERLGINEMSESYSCFVSTKSSIFDTKKSNIRIYSNIDEIVKQYNGKPVQRSLHRLQKMGVKSGVTIPLFVSDLVSGFLFMNSVSESQFSDLKDEDYSILCLVKLVALSCLNKALFGINSPGSGVGKILAGMRQEMNSFSADSFKGLLCFALEKRFNKKIKIDLINETKSHFFCALNPTVYTILKAIECVGLCPDDMKIILTERNRSGAQFIEFKVKNMPMHPEQLESLNGLKPFINQETGVSDGDFYLLIPFDRAETVDYST